MRSIVKMNESGHFLARIAVFVVAAYVAFAVGAPWLLHDAPPSAQDVLASKASTTPVSVPHVLKPAR